MKLQEADISLLHPWENSPRLNDHAVDAVAKSIKSYGFNVPILCDVNYEIIAGHTRWKAAKSLGLSKVPVILLDFDEKKRKAFSIADNKTAEIADWDYGKLRDVLNSLRTEDMDISPIGFTNQDLRRILNIDDMSEDNIPKPQGNVRTRTGDIWLAGAHRLLCGDSLDGATVKYLMQGNKMDFVFGGPQVLYKCLGNPVRDTPNGRIFASRCMSSGNSVQMHASVQRRKRARIRTFRRFRHNSYCG